MKHESPTAPVTIRATKDVVEGIDQLASAMDRSRNYVINQALEQYLETNAWQIERIRAGIADARAGRTKSADEVFDRIAGKFGWQR